jgi:phosphoribosylamine--glycine ligase
MVAIFSGGSTSRNESPDTDAVSFVLMEHVSGIEVGVGAFFDGVRFLRPACLDWEYKRFFDGDLGELTGEMGTVATYRGSERLFEATLGKLEERFRLAGHVGYVNINTIVDARGVWPLEFTCRFGYPGYSILEPLHVDGYGALFRAIMRQGEPTFRTYPGVSVGVVLTVPPFPYPYGYKQLSKGKRIVLRRPWGVDDRPHVHYCEVDFVRTAAEDELTAVGLVGYLMVVTGRSESCEAARHDAYRRAQNVVVPGLRYRRDIGSRFEHEHEQLRMWGWITAE